MFGFDYPQIAESVGRSEVNCRQIATRARKHVEGHRARFETDRQKHEELLDRFIEASENGDVESLKELLARDAVVYSDGGGKASAARRPFGGAERIAHFMVKVMSMRHEAGGRERQDVSVNGEPGWMWFDGEGAVEGVLTVDAAEGQIQTIRIVRNPDKLLHLRGGAR